MKKIGIIGGIGPESTIEYYRLLTHGFQEQLKTNHYPELLLHSIDMTEMLGYVFSDQLDILVNFLKKKIEVLETAHVDCIVLASNTPHLVFDELAAEVDTEMISIVEETCKEISASGIKKVGLLGTKSTMSKGFYQRKGEKLGVEIVVPNDKQQDYVHEKYMKELVFNDIKSETKEGLIQIIQDLQSKEQIEGIALAGTELPLILQQEDFEDLNVFNTTEIHVNAILRKMIH